MSRRRFVPRIRETIGQARRDAERLAKKRGVVTYLRCQVAHLPGKRSGYFADLEPGPHPMASYSPPNVEKYEDGPNGVC